MVGAVSMTAAQGSTTSVACGDTKSTPIMASLVAPLQVPSRDYDVSGFRLSLLYGDCRNFTGLDIGIAQRTAGGFTGLAVGGVNIAGGQFYGGQVGLVNWNPCSSMKWGKRSIGAQVGLFNGAESFCGLQDGLVNFSKKSFVGWQSGFLNFADDVSGLQSGFCLVGAVNVAHGGVYGVQIGLVNYARKIESGVQVGIVNIIAENGWAPVLPIVNGSF